MSTEIVRTEERFAPLPSGIDICYQTFGAESDPAILLIMGLGGPMGWWSVDLCESLARHGYFVIRFDNRDTGRSTKIRQHKVGRTELARTAVHIPGLNRNKAPYSLSDMAGDAVGLLDHLGHDAAHLVGVSMGGMIAQLIAIDHPSRASSLTSIMSTTGRRGVGLPHPKVLPTLLSSAGQTREEYVGQSLRISAVIGSPAFRTDEQVARERAYETYDRGWTSSGTVRQLLAVLTQSDRTAALGDLNLPAMVIHGRQDPLVHRSGGRATANAIPGAQHVEIEGMAHDLPPALNPTFVEAIVRTAKRASEPDHLNP